jgi:dCMP deaminase
MSERPPITINPNRIELDEAYLQMAEVWAKRSKANRLQVGALVVVGTQIISDGYNGMPSGWPEDACETYGPNGELVTKPELMHAEANALTKIARDGHGRANGGTLYTTDSPCPECAKLAKQCGIKRVVFRRQYRLLDGIRMLERLGIPVEQLKAKP